jgi:DNA ligase-associated metallophosphoesterase
MTAVTTIAGEELELHPERAVYWNRRRMLFVADPHFGKAASFRKLGVFVPKGTTNEGLSRLDALIERLSPEQIIFLGDFLHAKEGRNAETFAALATWRSMHEAIEMRLVRGNHDRRAGDLPVDVGIPSFDGPLIEPPFALAHHPVAVADHYVLAGHIHPCAVLTGAARQREKLPCFWFGKDVAVLPAFGDFTGCAVVDAAEGDSVWVVAADVVRVPLLTR